MHRYSPLLYLLLVIAFSTVEAQSVRSDFGNSPAVSVTQKWTAGWNNFGEPLNFSKSTIKWSVATHKLTLSFNLVGARPSKLYQVALNFFCTTFPPTFGQFPTDLGGGTCFTLTEQGVTKTVAEVEVGVVTTDLHGNGSFQVAISPVPSGTYELEFYARDSAGCNLTGGAGNTDCSADFQSPGPFGTATTITVP